METETRIPLTEAELLTRGKEMAQLVREMELAEQARSDAAKGAKEEIDEMDAKIKVLAKEVREKCKVIPAQMPLTGVRVIDGDEVITRVKEARDGHRKPFLNTGAAW